MFACRWQVYWEMMLEFCSSAPPDGGWGVCPSALSAIIRQRTEHALDNYRYLLLPLVVNEGRPCYGSRYDGRFNPAERCLLASSGSSREVCLYDTRATVPMRKVRWHAP